MGGSLSSDYPDHLPVIVIGASQAGLFAAHLLAQQGVSVDLYERTEHFGPKPRTLIVTPELERVLGFSASSAVMNRVHTLELFAAHRVVPIRLAEPDLIVERAELLRILHDKAVDAGVRIHWGQRFEALETDGRHTTAHFRTRGS